MRVFRIADSRHPVWSGEGAAQWGGRWNSPGRPVIHGSLTYACALLEILVHSATGRVPKHHVCVVAEVPDDISIRKLSEVDLPPGWDKADSPAARAVGDRWLDSADTAMLLVPSAVVRVEWEWNVLINPLHPDAARISVTLGAPVQWDGRLFSGRS